MWMPLLDLMGFVEMAGVPGVVRFGKDRGTRVGRVFSSSESMSLIKSVECWEKLTS